MLYEVENLSFAFEQKMVFENLTFSFPAGKSVGILGRSGQGKTTLLRIFAGSLTPTGGRMCGFSENFSWMAQQTQLFPWMSVLKNLEVIRPAARERRQWRQQAQTLLEELYLGGEVAAYPGTLSGGMQRRVELARALLYPGSLLLLDEPFASLDLNLRGIVADRLKKIIHREMRTLIFSTHHIDTALLLADLLLVMTGDGTPQLLKNPLDGLDGQPREQEMKRWLGELSLAMMPDLLSAGSADKPLNKRQIRGKKSVRENNLNEISTQQNDKNIKISEMERGEKRAQGHWLLAKMGKRVLRPGGVELTKKMLTALAIDATHSVIEMAPGLGVTTALALRHNPRQYYAVEQEPKAAVLLAAKIRHSGFRIIEGDAAAVPLDSGCADRILCEAMLTMQSERKKRQLIGEAARLLRPGGRYAVHEIAIADGVSPETIRLIQRQLSEAIKAEIRPQPFWQWKDYFSAAGLKASVAGTAPMRLLEPGRMIRDEGLLRLLKIRFNILTHPTARRRISNMRHVFKKYAKELVSFIIIAEK